MFNNNRLLTILAVFNFCLLILIVFVCADAAYKIKNRMAIKDNTLTIMAPGNFGNDVIVNLQKLQNISNKFNFDDLNQMEVYQLDDTGRYLIGRNQFNGKIFIGVNVGFIDDTIKSYRFYPITIDTRKVNDGTLYESIIHTKVEAVK